jgi:hypothetical protein
MEQNPGEHYIDHRKSDMIPMRISVRTRRYVMGACCMEVLRLEPARR